MSTGVDITEWLLEDSNLHEIRLGVTLANLAGQTARAGMVTGGCWWASFANSGFFSGSGSLSYLDRSLTDDLWPQCEATLRRGAMSG